MATGHRLWLGQTAGRERLVMCAACGKYAVRQLSKGLQRACVRKLTGYGKQAVARAFSGKALHPSSHVKKPLAGALFRYDGGSAIGGCKELCKQKGPTRRNVERKAGAARNGSLAFQASSSQRLGDDFDADEEAVAWLYGDFEGSGGTTGGTAEFGLLW